MLTCSALSVQIPGRTLVRDLTFNLATGEVLCVLGPNGVGKSLTLQTLAGLRPPAAGSIALDGIDLQQLSRRMIAARLGLLLQDDTETFPATVFATTLMGRHPHLASFAAESPVDHALARAALTAMGLEGLEDRLVPSLSGGERRRLALARLLAQDPGVLLLDEPVNHLDPRHQITVLTYLGVLAGAGHGVLMTLHDPTLAARFADQALLLFPDSSWILGRTAAVLTAANLERLFDAPYEEFVNSAGDVALLPTGA